MSTHHFPAFPMSVFRTVVAYFLAISVFISIGAVLALAIAPSEGRLLYSVQFKLTPPDKEAVWNFVDTISDMGFPGYVFTEETNQGEVLYYAHMGIYDTPAGAAEAIDTLRTRLKNPTLTCGIVYAGTPHLVPQAELAAMGVMPPQSVAPRTEPGSDNTATTAAPQDPARAPVALDFGVEVARPESKNAPVRPVQESSDFQLPRFRAKPNPSASPAPPIPTANPSPPQVSSPAPSASVVPPQPAPETPVSSPAPSAANADTAPPLAVAAVAPPAMPASAQESSYPPTPVPSSVPAAGESSASAGQDAPTPVQAAPSPSPEGRAYVLLVATVRNLTFSTDTAAKLRHKGHDPFILKVFDNAGQPWYLLCVGYASSREEAGRLAKVYAERDPSPVTIKSLDASFLSTRRVDF